jgi:hypothetical protein
MSLSDSLLLDPYPFDVWIAWRTDGLGGSGTLNDPYNGSTELAAAVPVTILTNNGQEATATASAHGYGNNDVVTIDGVTGTWAAQWNGTFLIYGVTSNSFKYRMNTTPGGAAGGLPVKAQKVLGYRFDDLMSALGANTRVHLGPTSANKPFLTRGYATSATSGWQAKAGMKIVGSGVDVTTLRLVGQAVNGSYFAIGHDFAGGPVDYFEVSELTIDSNLMIPVANSAVCGAVRVLGSHARVHRLKAINWGANDAKPLLVVAVVTADPASGCSGVADCGIEGVIAVSPAYSPAGAWITVLHAGPADDAPTVLSEAFGTSPFVRNCYVDCGSPTATAEYHALSMAWCRGGVIEGNQVHNTQYGGPYINSSSSRDLVVRNNVYRNVFKGPYWNLGTLASSYGSGSLTRNGAVATVTVPTGHYLSQGDRVRIAGTPNDFDGIHQVTGVAGNTFTFATSKTAGSATLNSIQKVFGVDRLVVEGNTVELAGQTAGELIGIHVHDNGLTGQDPAYPAYPFGDVVIRQNKIRYLEGWFDPGWSGEGIRVAGAKNVIISENVLHCAPANPIKDFRCGSVTYFHNDTPASALIQGYDGVANSKYSELETEAEDALLLTILQ